MTISVIALSGFVHVGKTTAARILEEMGFCYCRPSMVLANNLSKRGEKVTRESLQALGSEIHRSDHQLWLISETVRWCESSRLIAVDGIRWHEDREYLSGRFGEDFLHLHIVAPDEALIARHIALGGTAESYATVFGHDVEIGIPALAAEANITVTNSGTLNEIENTIKIIANRFMDRS